MQQKIFIPDELSVTSPFFYVIRHIITKKLYAGIKYGKKKNNSERFMTCEGYQTSSEIIKELIHKEGLASFEIIRIRHFITKECVIEYEHKFLVKVNGMTNDRFFNRTNGGTTFYVSPESIEIRRLKQIGRKHSEETKLKMKGHSRPHTEESKAKLRGRIITEKTRQKLRGRKRSEETKLKMKDAWVNRAPLSDDARAKRGERSMGRMWWNNGTVNCFQQLSPGDNWVKGMLFRKRKGRVKGLKWWNNGIITKQSEVCPDGGNWCRGRL
jgi:hypothetical protein